MVSKIGKALFSTPIIGVQVAGWLLLILVVIIAGLCIFTSIYAKDWEILFAGFAIGGFGMLFVFLLFDISYSNREFYTNYSERFNYLNSKIEELQDYNIALQVKVSNTLVENGNNSMKDYNRVLNDDISAGQKHTKDSLKEIYKDYDEIIYDYESNQFIFENGEELHIVFYGG